MPPSFNLFIEGCYLQLGCPPVGQVFAWTVYCSLLDLMRCCEGMPAVLTAAEDYTTVDEEKLDLLPGLRDLPETEGYMGGVVNGLGLHKCFAGQINFISI